MNIFQNQNLYKQMWKLSYNSLIVQQKDIWKIKQGLMHWILRKKTDLANLKPDVDNLDILN